MNDSARTGSDDGGDALVSRARAGDRAAWDRLVAEHLPRVWSVVWRIVRHREDAEDVSQETFLTAYQSLGDFRGDSAFSTWLHRIAVTRSLNHLDRAAERMRRRSRPLDRVAEDGSDEPDPEVEFAAAASASAPPSPVRALEAKDLLRRLADCLKKLPPAWRAVVALRDAESRSYEEIAAALGIELGTVRSRLSRSRMALKECVEEGGS